MLSPTKQLPPRTLDWLRHGLTLLFLLAILSISNQFSGTFDQPGVFILAALLGGYMALNIGANDAGNNIGPLVGSQVIGLGTAILLAGLFEAAGAFLAGGEVISTIGQGIIDPSQISDKANIVRAMLSALLAGGIWLHIATLTSTPVSTTHSIVGGVVGATIALGGFDLVEWQTIGIISSSWIIAPLLGGSFAALLLYLVKRSITYQRHMTLAASRVLPLLVGLMAWSFTSYLLLKGLKTSWRIDTTTAMISGFTIGLGIYLIIKPIIAQRTALLPNTKSAVNRLFNIPLIIAAALLSFAHGSNDVANAIAPVIAIQQALVSAPTTQAGNLTSWLLLVGVIGMPLGLILYGRRLVRTIASGITELDQIRAFCIVTSVSITVLLASQFGLPVSSTHITVGAIFGIGFLRERLKLNHAMMQEEIRYHLKDPKPEAVDAYLARFNQASFGEKGQMLEELVQSHETSLPDQKQRLKLQKLYRRVLVQRSALIRILSAWLLTLPASGLLAGMIYLLLEQVI